MSIQWKAIGFLAFLAACGGGTNPLETVEETDGGNVIEEVVANTVPTEVAGDLKRITFDPDNLTLAVDMSGLDAGAVLAVYTRAPTLDQNNMLAYQVNGGNLQRTYTALANQSDRKNVVAAAVADGGQFNRRFGGGYFSRIGAKSDHSLPTTGLVSYTGDYTGLYTPGQRIADPNIPDPFETAGNYVTVGTILLNASFGEKTVNGGITDRSILVPGVGSYAMDDISLIFTSIDDNGQFLGTVELRLPEQNEIGHYAGVFGGTNASDVAGVIFINPVRDQDEIYENGVFILSRCGLVGEGALCAQN